MSVSKWAIEGTSALLQAVKIKDSYTFYHCCRVGRQARLLARSMGLGEHEQTILEFAGLFHDIGKIGIPDNILQKPGRLNEEEMALIKNHPEMSANIIKKFTSEEFFKLLLPGVSCHHERYDGNGYPYKIEGDNIPLSARIIAVVDAVDAMTHTRAYRKTPLSMNMAKKELIECSGTQFDKHVVKIYLNASRFYESSDQQDENEVIIEEILKAA